MAESLTQLRSRYTWDRNSLRYRSSTGRFVSQRSVKQSLNSFVRRAQKEIVSLATEVSTGAISIPEWQRQTANLVKSTRLASAAAAKGGWAQMTQSDYGRVGQGLREQYKYLRKFAKDIKRGIPAGTVRNRAGMYAQGASGVYEETRRREAKAVFTQERNILGRSEHCKKCIEQTARGWVKVGELIPIGSRTCLSRCRCRYQFRKR